MANIVEKYKNLLEDDREKLIEYRKNIIKRKSGVLWL